MIVGLIEYCSIRKSNDNNNIYIAFENFDPNPNGIMTRMSRRDDYEQIDKNTDWVGFGLGWIGLGCIGLGWIWVGLDWVVLDWVGLDWVDTHGY